MKKDEKQESQEFYEAMPGTMEHTYATSAREDEVTADSSTETVDEKRRSILPWLLIPALLLLGWIFASAMSNDATEQSVPAQNESAGTGADTNVAP